MSGLLLAVAGALAHDLYARTLRPSAGPAARQLAFRISTLLTGLVVIVLGLQMERFSIAMLVGWAFAIAASSFFPLLALGIWWKGLTLTGAVTGTCVGGTAASAAILYTMVTGESPRAPYPDTLVGVLLAQPALWSIPLSFLTTVSVSLLTRQHVPRDIRLKMLRLHVPETLGLRTEHYVGD